MGTNGDGRKPVEVLEHPTKSAVKEALDREGRFLLEQLVKYVSSRPTALHGLDQRAFEMTISFNGISIAIVVQLPEAWERLKLDKKKKRGFDA
ncbi:MAG: hypothetical protein GY841_20045 [FCB group bacterium]|nr:hypothetical protein [FCB group bacterium]